MKITMIAGLMSALILTIGQSGLMVKAQDQAQTRYTEDITELKVEEGSVVDFENVKIPENLVETLQSGGNIIVFRYTGAGGPASPVDAQAGQNIKDDGQRISQESIEKMQAYGQVFKDLNIPINRVVSSEYYFVWQHAMAAFDKPILISRDLTGSLDFSDSQELAQSLQNLRNRTVTAPEEGTNTIYFTHQGKFDKAYGYYPPAGTTLIFRPDGSNKAQLIAVLSYDQLIDLASQVDQ